MDYQKKIVLKVEIIHDKCKATAMATVAKITGIKSMETNGEKGTMMVVGEVDVVCVVTELRKAKFMAVVVSVGPEKEEKKPDPPRNPMIPRSRRTPAPAATTTKRHYSGGQKRTVVVGN
ncbi:hypothetical protein GUJ93_ZPchr0003g16521 [Zizania palustris]|uniref:HMA domain-containing protein n=1 Tax=Zizania palustris TaxID=103762 RepID=A0A8J5V5M7_ZIZPA|nr:hypothetical protein GUJ93_ZPchr0003g16521 [Zizania palustris]